MQKYKLNENKDVNRVVTNTVMLYIMIVANYIFPLLTFPYLTRVLEPTTYGIIIFGSAAMLYFQLFMDFGFILSVTKKCAFNRNNRSKLEEIVASAVQAKFLLGIIGLIVLIILVNTISSFTDNYVYFLLAYLPIMTSAFVPDYLFRGLEIMKVITYRTILAKFIYTVLIFIVVKEPNDYLLIPVITSIGEITNIIWIWIYIKKKLLLKVQMVKWGKAIQEIREASMFFYSRIATTAYSSTNTILLGIVYSNNALLAQYGVANSLINTLRSLFTPISDSLYPYMVQKKDYKLIRRVLILSVPLIIIGTLGLFLLAEPIIKILAGPRYEGAVPIFRVMLPLIIMTLPNYILGFPVLGAMNKMKEANLSVIIAACFHLVGLGLLLVIGKITFITVVVLTCMTEAIVLTYRAKVIFKIFRREIVKVV